MKRAARIAIAIAVALVAAACGSADPSASVAPTIPRTPATAAPPTDAGNASPVPISPIPSDSAPAGGTVEDPSLLDILPADVDGVPVALEHQAFLDAAGDPGFAQSVRRAAFGIAIDGTDLVTGVVAEPAPGRFGEAFFRDWRDTYNAGACGQAGGVAGNAEAQIGGRTVYIATCEGGIRTYHAWLPEREAIVSAFALGERRLGEALMAGLRP